ncbi:MAG: NAD(P)-binding domain-containing protein [Silvibacterium sp.]
MTLTVDVAIVGAGPYGLSIAAHLAGRGIGFRIFGKPMETWRERMPEDMLLKSQGFASDLSSPDPAFSLRSFCQSHGLAYDDTRIPVSLKVFVEYGLFFQKHLVPDVDPRQIVRIERIDGSFVLEAEDGQRFRAKRVILAVGIRDCAWIPPQLESLPSHLLTHSSRHRQGAEFRGRDVTVIGGGASAIDFAALFHSEGAKVCILARRPAISYHKPPSPGGRSLWERLRRPSSGLGPGLLSRFFSDAPFLFRHFPKRLRLKLVREQLGPAPGWPMRERVEGKFPMFLGTRNLTASISDGRVLLKFLDQHGNLAEWLTEHVVAATGYRANVHRLTFLSPSIRQSIHTLADAPVLSLNFQSSVPGLYFVGLASVNSFGPVMRFTFGADCTARRIARHLQDCVADPAPRRLGSPAEALN